MRKELWKEKLRERAERTLYVRFSKVIRNPEEITDLFTGNFTIKLPRQSSKNCHVEFSTAKEAIKNRKALKNKTFNENPIIVRNAYEKTLSNAVVKKKAKKIKVPDIQPDVKLTLSIFVGNIKCGTKETELKEVFPGCVSVAMLKPYTNSLRSAILKMESIEIAAEYLLKKRPWPILHGNRLIIKPDNRVKHKRKLLPRICDSKNESELNDISLTIKKENSVS